MDTSEAMQDYKNILQFVTADDRDFDAEKLIEAWPDKVADQRLLIAMLVVRNAREGRDLARRVSILWQVSTVAAALALFAAANQFTTDLLIPTIGAFGAILVGQLTKQA